MVITNNQQKGNAGLSLAIGYFGSNGYTVSVPLNDTQWYDLVIEKMEFSKQFSANLHHRKLEKLI